MRHPSRPTLRHPDYGELQLLEVGGTAEVYVPTQQPTAPVVIKLLGADATTQAEAALRRELSLGLQLAHPSWVATLGETLVDGRLGLVQRYVDGPNLAYAMRQWSEAGTRLPVAAIVHALRTLCEGLEALHSLVCPPQLEAGAAHGDLSPHNILLNAKGGLQLTDLGHATSLTQVGAATAPAGKLAYLAPEQLQGTPPNVASDLFSLGVIAWELLTLHRLFAAGDAQETLDRLQRGLIVAPSTLRPELTPELDHWVLALLKAQPEARPSSAAAVRASLPELEVTPLPRVTAPPPRLSRGRSKRRALGMRLLGGALAALACFALWHALWRDATPLPQDTALRRDAEHARDVFDRIELAPPKTESLNTPEAPAVPAQLSIAVVPWGRVWVDGVARGDSPVSLDLTAGLHRIAVGKREPERYQRIRLEAGQRREVVIRLETRREAATSPGP